MATPRKRPTPAVRPQAEPLDDGIQLWDEYVAEAEPLVEPWRKRLPSGALLEVGCPTSDQIELLEAARVVGDVPAMLDAIFATDADEIVKLTGPKSFTLRIKLINDVMFHYGMSLANLPESAASST